LSLFWGKLKRDENSNKVLERLSLRDHCIDVAMVFRQLCRLPSIRRTLDYAAGIDFSERQLDRLAVFALAHDLGKCNWGFQVKQDLAERITAGHVKETLPLFFHPDTAEKFFSAFQCDRLIRWVDKSESVFRLFLAAISHHGRPAFTMEDGNGLFAQTASKFWMPNKGLDPMTGLRELLEAAHSAFPDAFDGASDPIPITESLQHRFAGLIMLADWLGSHSEGFFPFCHTGNRVDWSRLRARQAVKEVGLDISAHLKRLAGEVPDFSALFGFPPYPLQSRLSRTEGPLLIAESDTGSGKTEAALIHFLSLFAAGLVDSLYFALPTRVAARELYERVLKTMRAAFGSGCPPVLLAVPGYARIDGEPLYALPSEERLFFEPKDYRPLRQWAAERPKRFLSATVAVGTIDQALLSAIRVGHAHLRRACLDRSLLVIDEVHSSDVYMRALSRRMLSEHLSVGGRALLLSATLGSVAREAYLNLEERSGCTSCEEASALPYPALSALGSGTESVPNPGSRPKKVTVEPLPVMESPDSMLDRLERAVSEGMRVMVVLNTVQRAIDLCRAAERRPLLRHVLFSCNGALCPHHGRFARPDREILDKEVSRRLGKGSLAGPLLLIGTQTLEQSLDIDTDWLVTDLCPMDVLLQRIGRLHRHDRGKRPAPVCSILMPATPDLSLYLREDGEVRFSAPAGLGAVYEDMRILQLTLDLVAGGPVFDLPRDNRQLVEAATHPDRMLTLQGESWLKHGQHIEGKVQAMLMAAGGAVIPRAHFGDFSFPSSLDTRLVTRLGLDDRRLSLGRVYRGPFGREIDEIDIPGHLGRGIQQEEADLIEVSSEGLLIQVGRYSYRYSRFGLEKIDECVDG